MQTRTIKQKINKHEKTPECTKTLPEANKGSLAGQEFLQSLHASVAQRLHERFRIWERAILTKLELTGAIRDEIPSKLKSGDEIFQIFCPGREKTSTL